uniref:Uncharacterized protein n=1 Tax=Romanomermis culicivorax TaxID=13658 RepID=A0A915L392_ROMCU
MSYVPYPVQEATEIHVVKMDNRVCYHKFGLKIETPRGNKRVKQCKLPCSASEKFNHHQARGPCYRSAL